MDDLDKLNEEDGGGGDGGGDAGGDAGVGGDGVFPTTGSTSSDDIAPYPWPIGVPRGPGYDRPIFTSRSYVPPKDFFNFAGALVNDKEMASIMKRNKKAGAKDDARKKKKKKK